MTSFVDMRIKSAHIAIATVLLTGMAEAQNDMTPVPTLHVAEEWIALEATAEQEMPSKQDQGRFAHADKRSDEPESVGTTQELSDGTMIWTVGYTSEGAKSLSIVVGDMELPEGGSLVVFSPDGREAGEVKAAGKSGYSPSDIIAGDSLVVQYSGPATPRPRFRIIRVCRGFRQVVPHGYGAIDTGWRSRNKSAGQYGSSASCEIAARCLGEHDGPRRATCRLYVNNSTLGTGTLVNNTSEDERPLILTSAHVIGVPPMASCVALFGFEEPLCGEKYYNAGTERLSGATIVAYDDSSDMAILELDTKPSAISHPYWAGWSRTMTPEGDMTCYHHPYGDAKKVSVGSYVSPSTYSDGKTASGGTFLKEYHWRIGWTSGATEGGSSGSSLLDKEGHIIGGLTGGSSSCRLTSGDDYYWRLYKVWKRDATGGYSTLAEVLDPEGKDVETLDGHEGLDATGSYALQCASTYEPSESAESSGRQLDATHTAWAQPVEVGQKKVKVLGVSVMVDEVFAENSGSDGPKVSVSVMDSAGVESSPVTKLMRGFSSDNIGDFSFVDSPVTVDCGETGVLSVVVRVSDLGVEDVLVPKAVTDDGEGESSRWLEGDEWVEESGLRLMVDVIYTESQDTTINTVIPVEIKIRQFEDYIDIEGSDLKGIKVTDLGGRQNETCEAAQTSHMTIETTTWATGLYLVTIMTAKGERTYKIAINKR